MKNQIKISGFVLSVLGCIALTQNAIAQNTGKINIEIEGLRNQQGEVCLNIFSGSRGFPSDSEKAVKKQCFPITKRPLTVTLGGLKYGSYAVSVYHDQNGDKKLNRDSLGIPAEGFGFSNNPFVGTAPAKYREALLIVAGESTNIKIMMKYSINS
jgi:uncharacterized protein (DUF2141 family)